MNKTIFKKPLLYLILFIIVCLLFLFMTNVFEGVDPPPPPSTTMSFIPLTSSEINQNSGKAYNFNNSPPALPCKLPGQRADSNSNCCIVKTNNTYGLVFDNYVSGRGTAPNFTTGQNICGKQENLITKANALSDISKNNFITAVNNAGNLYCQPLQDSSDPYKGVCRSKDNTTNNPSKYYKVDLSR
jgi:hypothetical protein